MACTVSLTKIALCMLIEELVIKYNDKDMSVAVVLSTRYSLIQSHILPKPGPEVIKLFSCSTQLSMKFSLLINMKMPTIFGIFIFISREIFMLNFI